MKVRWSCSCAGGCGTWLVVGVRAEHRHRGFWCSSCYPLHRDRCTVCRDRDALPVHTPAPSEPALF